MFKEVMIDPELWGDWVFSSSVFPQLGAEHGRLVSGFPKAKNQLQAALLKIRSLEEGYPRRKEKMKARLNEVLDAKSVKNPYRDSQATGQWLDIVSNELERLPVDVVVTEQAISQAMSPEDISDGIGRWVLPQTQSVSKQSEDMIMALEPMLKLSRRIILVDKYFDPFGKKFAAFADQLMAKIGSFHAITRVDIHFSKSDMSADYLTRWVREKSEHWSRQPANFNFFKWDEGDIHYRAFLSEFGGVFSEYGFDKRNQIASEVPADKSFFARFGNQDFSDCYTLFSKTCIEKEQAELVCSIETSGAANGS